MKRWLLLPALLLPLLAMLGSIAIHQSALSGGSDWQIPVTGYDPRDPLRGQYVQFQYDWQLAGEPSRCLSARGCDLCLDRSAGMVRATAVAPGTACANRIDVAASRLTARPLRQTNGSSTAFFGRIFISEASAPRLEEQLRSGPMAVTARLDTNGRLVPRTLVAVCAPLSVVPASPDAPLAGPAPSAAAPPQHDRPPR